ncbi:MAG TPA: PqqD family protein [Acidimicrobiia bacterium]|jgi:hypothetical protein
MAVPASARLHRSAATLWREGEFGVVLLAPGSDEPQTLTGTGRALWHALAEPVTPGELANRLATGFGVNRGQVAADISPVLEALQRIGAIEPLRDDG